MHAVGLIVRYSSSTVLQRRLDLPCDSEQQKADAVHSERLLGNLIKASKWSDANIS